MPVNDDFFYIVDEDIFRLGNVNYSGLDSIRDNGITLYERMLISVIVANGKGISTLNLAELNDRDINGWISKIRKNIVVSNGLKLINDKEGCYILAPMYDMPLTLYAGLLQEIGLSETRIFKKEKLCHQF